MPPRRIGGGGLTSRPAVQAWRAGEGMAPGLESTACPPTPATSGDGPRVAAAACHSVVDVAADQSMRMHVKPCVDAVTNWLGREECGSRQPAVEVVVVYGAGTRADGAHVSQSVATGVRHARLPPCAAPPRIARVKLEDWRVVGRGDGWEVEDTRFASAAAAVRAVVEQLYAAPPPGAAGVRPMGDGDAGAGGTTVEGDDTGAGPPPSRTRRGVVFNGVGAGVGGRQAHAVATRRQPAAMAAATSGVVTHGAWYVHSAEDWVQAATSPLPPMPVLHDGPATPAQHGCSGGGGGHRVVMCLDNVDEVHPAAMHSFLHVIHCGWAAWWGRHANHARSGCGALSVMIVMTATCARTAWMARQPHAMMSKMAVTEVRLAHPHTLLAAVDSMLWVDGLLPIQPCLAVAEWLQDSVTSHNHSLTVYMHQLHRLIDAHFHHLAQHATLAPLATLVWPYERLAAVATTPHAALFHTCSSACHSLPPALVAAAATCMASAASPAVLRRIAADGHAAMAAEVGATFVVPSWLPSLLGKCWPVQGEGDAEMAPAASTHAVHAHLLASVVYMWTQRRLLWRRVAASLYAFAKGRAPSPAALWAWRLVSTGFTLTKGEGIRAALQARVDTADVTSLCDALMTLANEWRGMGAVWPSMLAHAQALDSCLAQLKDSTLDAGDAAAGAPASSGLSEVGMLSVALSNPRDGGDGGAMVSAAKRRELMKQTIATKATAQSPMASCSTRGGSDATSHSLATPGTNGATAATVHAIRARILECIHAMCADAASPGTGLPLQPVFVMASTLVHAMCEPSIAVMASVPQDHDLHAAMQALSRCSAKRFVDVRTAWFPAFHEAHHRMHPDASGGAAITSRTHMHGSVGAKRGRVAWDGCAEEDLRAIYLLYLRFLACLDAFHQMGMVRPCKTRRGAVEVVAMGLCNPSGLW